MSDAKRQPPRRWRLTVTRALAIVVICLALAPVVYWWPGRGALTYLGCKVGSLPEAAGPPKFALAAPRQDIPGVPNFAEVSPTLYRGGQPTRAGFAELKRRGVKTVISLRHLHNDRELLEGLGMRYVDLGFKPTDPNDRLVAQFLEVVLDPANQPVFVHCKAGADRTGALVAVYRVVVQGWPMSEAVRELPLFGFHGVWTSLEDYLVKLDPQAVKQLLKAEPPPRVEVIRGG
jgi:tyrosine-protein phosphatase SIW14